MKIKIQITVESDEGQPGVVQEVAHLDRGTLRPETAYWPHPTKTSVKDVLDAPLAERSGPRLLPRPPFTRSAT
jgi:hypothetical protein